MTGDKGFVGISDALKHTITTELVIIGDDRVCQTDALDSWAERCVTYSKLQLRTLIYLYRCEMRIANWVIGERRKEGRKDRLQTLPAPKAESRETCIQL